MQFTVTGSNSDHFYAWVRTHNSKHRKVIVLKEIAYTVDPDGPYCLIGMYMGRYDSERPENSITIYDFLGDPTDLLPVLAKEFSDLTFTGVRGEFTITKGKLVLTPSI